MERVGLVITVIWITLISILLYLKFNDAASMSLNEWGDFLAGVTAPVAFLWLIIGYMLQRKELGLNTEALILNKNEIRRQANELAQQTQFQKMQAEAAYAQSKEVREQQSTELFKRKLRRKREQEM
ncbi:TPA: hypothetical protein ACMDRZ_003863 [Vibrio cholerae]|uniref:hypothetical protein n=1 Tax=Vibrio TaxID=662 RepID=UPI0015829534|nr:MULTISPECIES: hypothetical protein [Vibrio]EGQ8002320.1 hypothetical protein [Vibrio vulnificus]EHD2271231.1 hypothetical protein [Vibrio cholerae]EIC2299156.1 hypothetical protein [Vibrio cholerae]EIJ2221461.1 hypothetical protein [Vibrio cholerae]EJL6912719.1 hypothetical protein [Vibrio cholerae]